MNPSLQARRRALSWVRATVIVVLPALVGCVDAPVTSEPAAPEPEAPLARIDGPYVEWNFCEGPCDDRVKGAIALREVACSAKIDCSQALLFDDQLNRRPTVVTGFACEFPASQPADALLGFHPLVTCYDEGDPGDPGTWTGPHVIDADADSHLFFAAADNRGSTGALGSGLSWLDAAQRLGTMAGYVLCHVHAYGFVGFSPSDGEPRRVMQDHFAPVVEFDAVIEPGDGINDFDCHDEPGGLSWVRPRVVRSVTHDRPNRTVKGQFPATHDIIMIDDADGLVAIAVVGSTFPPRPDATPVAFVERDLDGDGHLEAAWTCAESDAGQLTAIAVQLAGGGIIVVKREVTDLGGTRAWDCERGVDADCLIYSDEDVGVVAPCLLPVILPH